MIKQKDIIDFFDRCAPTWDAETICSDKKVNTILDNAGVCSGSRVLDVACGTGVLMPYYIKRGALVTGIDISPEMIKLARKKFHRDNIQFICGDAQTKDVGEGYDAIVIYNAFPHFPNSNSLIERLSSLLAPNGFLTVAHGAGREVIDEHHRGSASKVSIGLIPAEELASMFVKNSLEITTVLSTPEIYQVAGKRSL